VREGKKKLGYVLEKGTIEKFERKIIRSVNV
jgi:hypothetical protein